MKYISHGDNWYFSDSNWICFQMKIHRMVIEIKTKMTPVISFLPFSHSGCRILSCPVLSVYLSVHPLVRPSVPPLLPLYSQQYLTDLFMFHTAIDHSRNMNSIDYGVSMFIVEDFVVLWNFREYTDWCLGLLFECFRTMTSVWIHRWLQNNAQNLH